MGHSSKLNCGLCLYKRCVVRIVMGAVLSFFRVLYASLMKYYTQDENALGLALTVEKLYDKAELAGVSRVKEKISDLKNIANRLNELDTESNM